MAKATSTDPTDAEIQDAQDVMRRAQEAQQRAAQEKIKPLLDLVDSTEFGKLREQIDSVPVEMMADMSIAPHIMALRAGLNGLATLVQVDPAPRA